MKLPFLQSGIRKRDRVVGEFRGLDERLVIDESSLSAMRNMSDRYYPAIATRAPRGAPERTIGRPNGLYYKNGLFYVNGTACYYKDTLVSGLTVTDGKKQIVGMGAYLVIFPDKKIYNTHTGEVTSMDASYSQSGTITFAELSTDSVFCKISATGIGNTFRKNDGVKFTGVGDDSFLVDGEGATKVITEIGTDYIVVTASIQNAKSGEITMLASSGSTRINADGIGSIFKVNDHVKIIGLADEALNVTDKTVSAVGSGYIVINQAFPSKTYTQSKTMSLSPYYSGSNMTRMAADDLGTKFSAGDVVTVSGCSNSALNGTKTVKQAGTNYIILEGTTSQESTQASGITITRTQHTAENATVKRTSFTVASGITISRNSQTFDFVCEHDNRLWACSSANHEIYASKLGDPTNWNCYEGISTDSYTVSVGSDGDFTGCCSHMGYVLFFKERCIHMMYGSKPSNYQLNVKEMPGVREGCGSSLCVVNETLYYAGRDGIYSFDGAFPKKISEGILGAITEAVSSQQDALLYMSCLKDGARTVLVYNPEYKTWHEEDDTEFQYAVYGGGKLWYIDANDALRTITGSDPEKIHWFLESGDLQESSMEHKYISGTKFNFQLDAGAEANIYLRFDDDPLWHRKGTVHAIKPTTYTIPIVSERCQFFRWRIEGKGGMKLLAMGITVEGGSEIGGIVQSWCRR